MKTVYIMGKFPNPSTQFSSTNQPDNPGNKKGNRHISTWIQEMLNDEEFETTLLDAKKGAIDFKGAPLKAIIKVATHRAIHDKDKGQQWAEWLAKHGWKQELDITSGGEKISFLNEVPRPKD